MVAELFIKIYNWWRPAISTAPPPTVSTDILYASPTIDKIWDSGVQYTGFITTITNFDTVNWEIVNVKTRAVAASGSGLNVTATLNFVTMAACNLYDVRVVASNGSISVERIFPAAIRCLPHLPVSYNETWTASGGVTGQKNGAWTDRPGYAIKVTGSLSGRLDIWDWKSDDPTNPVQIIFENCDLSSNTFNFSPTSLKNVIIRGLPRNGEPYGLKMTKTPGGTSQMLHFTWNGYGGSIDRFSQNVIVCGLDADATGGGSGAVCFRVQPGERSSVVNKDTRAFAHFYMFNCRGKMGYDENYYIGYNNDTPDANGNYWTQLDSPVFTDCEGLDANNEIFQLNAINALVVKNKFIGGGAANNSSHENTLQLSEGCYGADICMNILDQTRAGRNTIGFFTGKKGGNCEIHGNIMRAKGPGDAGNWWGRCDELIPVGEAWYKNYCNTYVTESGTPFTLYEPYTSIFNKFWAWRNLFVSGTVGQEWTNASGMNAANLYMDNYKALYSNIDSVKFVNKDSMNYRLQDNTSPAIGTWNAAPTTVSSPYAEYDAEGYKFDSAIQAYGGISNYHLLFAPPVTKTIQSVAAQTDITVNTGTAFGSIPFPSTVQVTYTDASTANLSVTWSSAGYNSAVNATYPITGTLTLPSNVVNPSNLQAEVNVIVQAVTPITLRVNLFTGTASGWVETGATSPNTGNNTTRDYGILQDGIGLRALNPVGNIWNAMASNGATTGANTGVFPDNVLTTYWYCSGTNIGKMELYNVPAGTYSIQLTGSRGSIAGPRTCQYRVNGGSWQTLNVANNTANALTFTGITPVSGVILIEVQSTTPTDVTTGHINGFILTNQ